MKLNAGVLDRLVLLSLLPDEGSFVTLKLVRKLKDQIGFDEAEIMAFGLEKTEKGVHWNPATDRTKEIELGEVACDLLSKRLKELDATGKLTVDHIALYERLVDQKDG